MKRQRVVSSSSDSHSDSQKSDEEIITKRKKNDIKTYASPKSKKSKVKTVLIQLNKSNEDNDHPPKATSPIKDKGSKENDVKKSLEIKKETVTVKQEKNETVAGKLTVH